MAEKTKAAAVKFGGPSGTLNAVDWKKIFKGAIVAIVGALLGYVTSVISGMTGPWMYAFGAVWSVVANVIRKWIEDNSGTP